MKKIIATNRISENLKKTSKHPCFNPKAHEYARIHLPIAPACNISCNYCNRKFDCANESRPGVTSLILSPKEAVETYINAKNKLPNLKVVGIAGPGDALANWSKTAETIELIKAVDPDVTFCLSTNGLMLPKYADALTELGVSHITITINAVDPNIATKIYSNVLFDGNVYTKLEAAAILIKNQFQGLKMMSERGAVCKVNIVMIKDINENQIKEIVEMAKANGAYMTNIMKMIPVTGSVFENVEPVSNEKLSDTRKSCEDSLKQMYHCKQCRADAVGLLGQDMQCKNFSCKSESAKSRLCV